MVPHPRFPLVLPLLLVLTIPAAAQPAGTHFFVSMTPKVGRISHPELVPVNHAVYFEVRVGWNSGVIPEDVVIKIDVPGVVISVSAPEEGTCSGEQPVRCSLNARKAEYQGLILVGTMQFRTGKFSAEARLSSPTPDPYPPNNVSKANFEVVTQPALDIESFGMYPQRIDPSEPGGATVFVFNTGAAATNARLVLTLPQGGTFTGVKFVDGAPDCSVAPDRIVCTRAHLSFYDGFRLDPQFLAPDRLEGGEVTLHAVVTTNEPDHDPADNAIQLRALLFRHVRVTNTLDEGAGSLRQAILDANTLCAKTTCKITFRIPPPVPDDGWFTIRPESVLPEIRALVQLEGAPQTEFTGDTNPGGPEIEINGHRLPEGHGLHLRQLCDASVSDLTINGFPGHAIELDGQEARVPPCNMPFIVRNYLGTDPRGLTAVPNGRGVVLTTGNQISIQENLISGNHRAGIFLANGLFAFIRKNRIGINSKGEPLGNGASGVFLNVGTTERFGWGADVEDNVIAYNGEWGVARTPNGEILLTRNSIYGNTSQGIDIGLDNETPNRGDDSKTTPNKPDLFSASYDPVRNATIVRGRLESRTVGTLPQFRIDVYASSGLSRWGYAQGEEMVATKHLMISERDFEIAVPRDLRGKFITVTNTRSRYVGLSHDTATPADTSEFSNAVEAR